MAGRPKKSDTTTKAKTTAKDKETTNVDVAKQLEEMKKQMELLLKNQAKLEEENEKLKEKKVEAPVETKVEEEDIIVSVDPNKRVKMIHMLQGGTTLRNPRANIRFENFLQPRYARYEDVEDFRHGKYHKLFETAGIYVVGKKNREALMLDAVYNELGISDKVYGEMLKLDAESLVAKLATLPLKLQTSFSTYFIEEAKNENPDCISIGKWSALSNYFSQLYGKDISFSAMINE